MLRVLNSPQKDMMLSSAPTLMSGDDPDASSPLVGLPHTRCRYDSHLAGSPAPRRFPPVEACEPAGPHSSVDFLPLVKHLTDGWGRGMPWPLGTKAWPLFLTA